MSTDLSVPEVSRLADLERVIETGLQTFVEVGSALLEIRSGKLYRTSHGTFQQYCQQRWSLSDRHARRIMDAAEIAKNIGPIGPLSLTESQVRPLTSLDPQQQREAWAEATKDNPAPTAREVCEAAEIIAPTHQWQKPENEFCEVGWILLTTESDMAVLALTPGNEEWQKSALAFFGSLRKRKIVTVS